MTFLIVCMIFGALVGISAARWKGFNIAAGALGGALLGPFAVQLYFISSANGKKAGEVNACSQLRQGNPCRDEEV